MRVLAEMGLLLVLGLAFACRGTVLWRVHRRPAVGRFRRRIGGMAASLAMVLGLVYGVSRHRRGGAFMVRVYAAHRLRYCTAAGPRLDRSPGWGTDCGKRPLPQCLADRGLSPFPCRCNAFGPVAFGRRALDMGVAADRALVRPWHRPSPDAGDDAGRPAWIRSGPGPRLLGRGAARVAARAGQGARILAGHSFAHRRHR